MFARVTIYRLKPGALAAATDLQNSVHSQIMGLPGLRQFINLVNEDGQGYVISLSDSAAIANANSALIAEIWKAFAPHLEGPPTPGGYDVIANWSN
ncbi:hypothetical protein [uncultured Paracoccus sp.]|uniref:hypothetical protein n=1 Tax=uncultured Paracoccus sp. TaxID=189685 RepID=UPI00260A7AD2|nr:hypothetical protein [uncultured Paracoccus sp.]